MHGNPRRMASLPSWETISEPKESDDDEEGDENEVDEITSTSMRTPASATPSGSQNVDQPSPASPRPRRPPPAGPISPSRTQPDPSNVDLAYNPFDRSKDILKKLNTPGKRSNDNRSAMPPPSSSAVQSRASIDSGPASSSTQSSMQRFGNFIHHSFSESGTSPSISFNASPSRPSTSTSAQSTQNRPVSKTSNVTSNTSPSSPLRGSAATPTQSQASSSRLPPASQPPPRPQVKSFVSAPPLSQPAKSSSVTGSNKGKEKEKIVIELDDSDEETASVSSRPMTLKASAHKSAPIMPLPKNPASSISKKPYTQPSSARKRPVSSRAAESDSEDEFPSLNELSQRYCSSASVSPRKSPIASRSLSNRAGRDDDDDSDVPISSASQAPRKPLKPNGQRDGLPGSVRERVDRLNKSPSKSDSCRRLSSSHGSKQNSSARSTVQSKGKSITAPFPSTQPSSSSIRVGQSRMPPLSQPANEVRLAARQTSSKSSSLESRDGPTSAVKDLGIIDLSDSSDEEGKKEKRVIGGVIDLTLDDEGSPPLMPATQPVTSAAKCPSSSVVLTMPATQPVRSVPVNVESSSPPAIRPKPRISAILKEMMASAKPQPPDSRPLDVSRRRSESGTLSEDKSIELEGMDVDKDAVLPRREAPSADASPAEATADVMTSAPAEATEQVPGSPGVNFTADEGMDMYDFDGPADQAPNTSDASEDIAMQTVDADKSSSVDSVRGDREETSEPLERARELRSPSESAQMLEIQSQSQDANEGDLILEPSISRRPSVSQPLAEIAPNEGQGIDQLMSVALSPENAPSKKAETLTDKLDSLEISQAVAAMDGQEHSEGPEVQMADIEGPKDVGTSVVAETESSAVVQAEPVGPPSVLTNVAAPLTSPGIKPTSPASTSTPSPTMSAKQARLKRAASPGAAYAPSPKGNFMGMMPYVPKNTSPSRPSPKDVAVVARVSPEDLPIGQSAGNDTRKVDGTEEDRQNSLDASNSMSESPGVSNADKPSVAVGPDKPIPTSGKPTIPLSPRSRAKQRIPDPPPPRKLNLPGPTPLSVLGIHPLVRGSRSKSPHTVSNAPPATQDIANNDAEPVKELATVQKLESPAMVSARKLESILGGIRSNKNTTSSTTPSPITNVLRESGPSLKPESMPYVKKRMMEHTMQSPDSSSVSSRAEAAVSPKQTECANASSPGSLVTEADQIGKNATAAPGMNASSEEVDAGLSASSSGFDAHETTGDEQPETGTNVTSGRRRRYWFARKSTRKLAPKKGNRANSSVERKKPSAPTRQSRKRSLSASAHSIANDDLERPAGPRRVASKRPRVVDSDDVGVEDTVAVRKSSRKARKGSATSTSRSSRGASASSADPMDVLNEPLGEDSDTSLEPSTTSDAIVDRFANFKIEPVEGSDYPIVADRYFMNRDYGPEWYHVDDIPTELVDEVNDTPAWCRNPVLIRQIFEAAIIQNTTEDEPGAPAIRVVNNIDDEATPAFNFYYTNRMYHGHGVPPPEYKSLQGCKCIGLCDPTSKTCACVARQRKIFKDHDSNHRGFVYDNEGRVKDEVKDFPIFECNDACGCSDECFNRVVQNGRKCSVNIVKTKNKGWGVFAGKKIRKGTFIGIYSGEILTHEESLMRGAVYDKIGNTYLFDIDFFHLKENEDDDPKYVVDAYHVGNFTRLLSHSCEPNCKINAVHINDMILDKALLAVFAVKDINAGEELTFSYFGEIDDEVIREAREKAKDRPYQQCLCESRKCIGILFTYAAAPTIS